MDPIFVYDTTLRDGTQGENISFSAEEKLKSALRLDDIGIHYIEGGWPGSNPKDLRFFELAKTVKFKNARLAAFGCTRRPGVPADADEKLQALIDCGAGVVAIFGKSWDLHVTIEKDKGQPCQSHATVKVAVGGKHEITAAEGYGPVSALDNALRKALGRFFPDLDTMRLVDFKVRVIDGSRGTAARVRVLIDSRDQDQIWSTIGVSEDIIEASWHALADSFQFKLAREKQIRGAAQAALPFQTNPPTPPLKE